MKLRRKSHRFELVSIYRFIGVLVVLTLTVAVSLPAEAQLTPTPPALLNTNATSDSEVDSAPQLTTDGAGNWVAVWTNIGGVSGADIDLFVSTSTDDRATWSSPSLLNTNGVTDSWNDLYPQVTTDGAGNWVAVWESNEDLGGIAGLDKDIFVARSSDNGATWTAPALLNTNGTIDIGNDNDPQVTTDSAGNWVAVWWFREHIGTDEDIYVATSTDNGTTWTTPTLLNTNGASDAGGDRLPQVTTDGMGNWVAVWVSDDPLSSTVGWDYDIFVARSTDNGATWTAPAALNSYATSDTKSEYSPQVTTDGVGNWVAVWTGGESPGLAVGVEGDIFVTTSTDNGATWTAAALLNTDGFSDTRVDDYPQLTTDGAGNWVTVWNSRDNVSGELGLDNDIFMSTSTDNGATWTAPALLNSNGASDTGSDRAPQLTTDGADNWVVVWVSDENLGGTAGTDNDIFEAAFSFAEEGGSSGGGGGCLVATAAYGTPMESQIDALREVRDIYLLNTAAGSAFVDAYYTFSPPIADFVAKHPVAATTVRVLLTPILAVSNALWTLPFLAETFVVLAAGYLLYRRRLYQVKA